MRTPTCRPASGRRLAGRGALFPLRLILSFFLGFSAHAAEPAPTYLDRLRAEAANRKEAAAALAADKEEAATALANIRSELAAVALEQRQRQSGLDDLVASLQGAEGDQAKAGASLDESRAELGRVLSALVHLRRFASLHAMNGVTTGKQDWMKQAAALQAALPFWRRRLDVAQTQYGFFQKTANAIAYEQQALAASQAARAAAARDLEGLIERRTRLLETQEQELAAAKEASDNAARTARDLQDLMARMPRGTHAGGTEAGIVPVVGPVVRPYGARDEMGMNMHGITYKVPDGTSVLAPAGGRIAYAGPFKGYGTIVIIDHGHNKEGRSLHSLLAGLGKISVRAGQEVLLGEPVGTLDGVEGVHTLYYERRVGGIPVEPYIFQGRAQTAAASTR